LLSIHYLYKNKQGFISNILLALKSDFVINKSYLLHLRLLFLQFEIQNRLLDLGLKLVAYSTLSHMCQCTLETCTQGCQPVITRKTRPCPKAR